MKIPALIIACLFITVQTSFAQSIDRVLSKAFKTISDEIDPEPPKFNYYRTDTAKGIELHCYFGYNSDRCTYYKFFIEGSYNLDTFSSPEAFLFKSDTAYHYLGHPYEGSDFGCFVLHPDTFYYCRKPDNIIVADPNNYNERSKHFYRRGTACFQAANVVAIVDRFRSTDTTRRNLYYPFLARSRAIDFLYLTKYRAFLSKTFIDAPELFRIKRGSIPNFNCSVIMR